MPFCYSIRIRIRVKVTRIRNTWGKENNLDEHGYTLANVKIAAIKFIVDHWLVVKDEPGYLQLIKDYAELDIDITDAINSIK